MNYRALCFVDMPFGQKSDLKSGVLVDFDQIYNRGTSRRLNNVDWKHSGRMKSAPAGTFTAQCSPGCCWLSLLWRI